MEDVLDGRVAEPSGHLAIIDATAGIHGIRLFTRNWLHSHAALLAEALRCAAGGHSLRGRVVALVYSSCCAEAVAGMLAIWQCDAIYCPLDADTPAWRLQWMIDHAHPLVVLAPRNLTALGIRRITVSIETGQQVAPLSEEEGLGPSRVDLSKVPPVGTHYILYTSGSTGRPKAVCGAREGLAGRLRWGLDAYPFAPGEVAIASTAPIFVDALCEVLGPLHARVPLLLPPRAGQSSMASFVGLLSTWRVSRLVTVPTALRMLLDTCELHPTLRAGAGRADEPPSILPHLKMVVCSGEVLPIALVRRAHRMLPHARLLNLYGTTECSADVLCFDCGLGDARSPNILREDARASPLGRSPTCGAEVCPLGRSPTCGAEVRLIAQDVASGAPRLAADGEVAELWVGGAAVGFGYLGEAMLSAASFQTCPPDAPGAASSVGRWFRTGDLVVRDATTGTIRYHSRADEQIQLRGCRVDVLEIEAAFEGLPGVARVVAVPVRTDPDAASLQPFGASSSADSLLLACLASTHDGTEADEVVVTTCGLHVRVTQSLQKADAMARWAEARLPVWMRPTSYAVLEDLPTLPGAGKLDRAALSHAAPWMLLLLHEERSRACASVDCADEAFGAVGGRSGCQPQHEVCGQIGAQSGQGSSRCFSSTQVGGSPEPRHPAAATSSTPKASGNETAAHGALCAALCSALGLRARACALLHTSFAELGGTSVLAVRVAFELGTHHGWVLPPEVLMERRTLFDAAEAMTQRLESAEGGCAAQGGVRLPVDVDGRAESRSRRLACNVLDGWGRFVGVVEPAARTTTRLPDGKRRAAEEEEPVKRHPRSPRCEAPRLHGKRRTREEEELAATQAVTAAVGQEDSSCGARMPPCMWSPHPWSAPAMARQPAVCWALGAASWSTVPSAVDPSVPSYSDEVRTGADGAGANNLPVGGTLSEAPGTPRLTMRTTWSRDLGQCVDASPLLVCEARRAGEAVCCYVGSHSGRVDAYCLASGEQIWTVQLPDRVEASCALSADGQDLYIGGYDEHLHALRRADGARLWSRQALGAIKGAAACLPSRDGGAVVSGCFGGALAVLEPRCGGVIWEMKCEGGLFARPLVDASRRRLLVADLKGYLRCARYAAAKEGGGLGFELLWSHRLGETSPIFASPVFLPCAVASPQASVNDTSRCHILVGAADGKLRALTLDEASCTEMWCFDAHAPIFSTPSVAHYGGGIDDVHVYITSQEGRLHCLCAHDGQRRWSTEPLHFNGHAAPAVDTAHGQRPPGQRGMRHTPSVVCCAATDGTLHLFDCMQGRALLEVPLQLPAPIFSSPVICASRIIVGCRDNTVISVDIRESERRDTTTACVH